MRDEKGIRHRRIAVTLLIGSLLILPWLSLGCGSKSGVTGRWEGLLDASVEVGPQGKPEDAKFHVVLNIRKTGDQLQGSFESVEDRSGAVPVDSVEFKNGSLTVKFRKQSGIYSATLNSDGTEFYGTLKQGRYDMPLILKRAADS